MVPGFFPQNLEFKMQCMHLYSNFWRSRDVIEDPALRLYILGQLVQKWTVNFARKSNFN